MKFGDGNNFRAAVFSVNDLLYWVAFGGSSLGLYARDHYSEKNILARQEKKKQQEEEKRKAKLLKSLVEETHILTKEQFREQNKNGAKPLKSKELKQISLTELDKLIEAGREPLNESELAEILDDQLTERQKLEESDLNKLKKDIIKISTKLPISALKRLFKRGLKPLNNKQLQQEKPKLKFGEDDFTNLVESDSEEFEFTESESEEFEFSESESESESSSETEDNYLELLENEIKNETIVTAVSVVKYSSKALTWLPNSFSFDD